MTDNRYDVLTFPYVLGRIVTWWRFLLVMMAAAAVAALVAIRFLGEFEARATFAPESAPASRSATLAAQLGLPVGGAAGGTVDYYARLLGSRVILAAAVSAAGSSGASARDFDYAEAFGIGGATPAIRQRRSVTDLRARLRVDADALAGMVLFTVRGRDAAAVEAVAQRLLDAMADFNVNQRVSRSSATRREAEQRLAEVRERLRLAEVNLSRASGRDAEAARRAIASELLVADVLATAVEQARIDEVADTPVITLLDRPEGSARRRLSRPRAVIIAVLLALTAAGAVIAMVELLRASMLTRPADWRELERTSPRLGGLLRRLGTASAPR